MTLKEYNAKRNFDITAEPKGNKNSSKKNLKFVIQYHEARAKHYDFRLEWKGVAISFAVPKNLSQDPKHKRLAINVEDHPLEYMNFSGTIPKGQYGGGTVEIWDKGIYLPLSPMPKGLKSGLLKVFLFGEKAKGEFVLTRIDEKNWLIIKKQDEFAFSKTKISKNPFDKIEPQLALLTNKIPTGKNFLFEIKYDGYRIVAFVEKNKVKLKTRNNIDYTKKFSQIALSLTSLSQSMSMILDGEMVVFNEKGQTDFGALQNNLRTSKNNFFYVVFDILAFNGTDLRQQKLLERKKILTRILQGCPKNIIESEYIIGKGKESFEASKKLGLEGIVGKKIDSVYSGTRNGDWIKIKCSQRQEFVIVGFLTTEKNQNLSALLLGYYSNKKLIFVGKVGTGFSDIMKKELRQTFDKLKSNKSFLEEKIKEKNVIFLKPKLVAEIKFAGFTKDKFLRQPSFVGLRTDKNAKNVVLESNDEKNKN